MEQIDQYNNLSAMLMNSQISPIDKAYHWSILKKTNTTLGTKQGLSTGTMNPNNATVMPNYYTTTLLSGVVGSLSRSYIPLFALNGYISFRLNTVITAATSYLNSYGSQNINQ